MIIPNGAVVAVVDGASHRMFRNTASEPHISLEAVAVADIDIKNQGSGARHGSSSANPDSARLDEDNYVSSVAGYLNRQVLDGKIKKLFLIADPGSLGELRRHFHAELEATLIGDLAKDLTGHPVAAIESVVSKA